MSLEADVRKLEKRLTELEMILELGVIQEFKVAVGIACSPKIQRSKK